MKTDPFESLFEHIQKHFHEPDLQAARIILGTAYSHFLEASSKPVWLFVVGAPSSGKTSITISALRGLESMFGDGQPWGHKGSTEKELIPDYATDDGTLLAEFSEGGKETNFRRRTDSKVKLISVINNNTWISHHAGTQAPGWLEQLSSKGPSFLPPKPKKKKGEDTKAWKARLKKWSPHQQISDGNGLFLCPDFTVITQMRRDMRGEIMGQLRRIFDGEFEKKIGLRLEKTWKGKITIIAAVTHEIDHFLRLSSNLGERFLQIKWHFSRSKEVTRAAIRQIGKTSQIDGKMRELTRDLFARADLFSQELPTLTVLQEDRIHAIAELLAQSRCVVKWHFAGGEDNQRDPDWIGDPESTARIGQELACIAFGTTALSLEKEVQERDIQGILRVGVESLDRYRSVVLQAAIEGKPFKDYSGSTRLMESARADLIELGVLEHNFGDSIPILKPYFKGLVELAGFSSQTFPKIGAAGEGDLINERGELLELKQHSQRFEDDDRLSCDEKPPKLLSSESLPSPS